MQPLLSISHPYPPTHANHLHTPLSCTILLPSSQQPAHASPHQLRPFHFLLFLLSSDPGITTKKPATTISFLAFSSFSDQTPPPQETSYYHFISRFFFFLLPDTTTTRNQGLPFHFWLFLLSPTTPPPQETSYYHFISCFFFFLLTPTSQPRNQLLPFLFFWLFLLSPTTPSPQETSYYHFFSSAFFFFLPLHHHHRKPSNYVLPFFWLFLLSSFSYRTTTTEKPSCNCSTTIRNQRPPL